MPERVVLDGDTKRIEPDVQLERDDSRPGADCVGREFTHDEHDRVNRFSDEDGLPEYATEQSTIRAQEHYSSPVLHEILADGPGRACLLVSGDIDIDSSRELTAQADLATSTDGCHTLVVDLSKVEFIDSSGLGALVAIRNLCVDRNVTLHLRGTPPPVRRLLELSNLDAVFDQSPDV